MKARVSLLAGGSSAMASRVPARHCSSLEATAEEWRGERRQRVRHGTGVKLEH